MTHHSQKLSNWSDFMKRRELKAKMQLISLEVNASHYQMKTLIMFKTEVCSPFHQLKQQEVQKSPHPPANAF